VEAGVTAKRYGEGSVYQRASDGLWVATFKYLGRRRVVYGTTEQEALKKRRLAAKRLATGGTPTPSRATFAAAAQRWISDYSRTLPIGSATRKNYIDVLRLHVLPTIGQLQLETIKASDVAKVMVEMLDKGYSASYRHQAHKAISHVFKMTIADGELTANPARSVPAPRGTATPAYYAGREDVRALIANAQDERLLTFLVMVSHTGMRISEALGVRWSDVNFESKSIAVLGKGNRWRSVYLTPSLDRQLRVWRREQAKRRLSADWWSVEGDWVISTDIGTKMDSHNWRKKHFNPLRSKVCPNATPHSLRHGFATIMLEEGVSMKVVSAQLGHSSTRITEDTYSHVTARLQEQAGAAIERVLGT
jgi:integrase